MPSLPAGPRGWALVIGTALAQAGADVAIVSRTQADCEATAAAIADQTGRRAIAVTADVTQAAQVERMAERVRSRTRAIDILVNNAGINIRGAVHGAGGGRLGCGA